MIIIIITETEWGVRWRFRWYKSGRILKTKPGEGYRGLHYTTVSFECARNVPNKKLKNRQTLTSLTYQKTDETLLLPSSSLLVQVKLDYDLTHSPWVPCIQTDQWGTPNSFSISRLFSGARTSCPGESWSLRAANDAHDVGWTWLAHEWGSDPAVLSRACLSCLQPGTRMRMSQVRRGCPPALTTSCTS